MRNIELKGTLTQLIIAEQVISGNENLFTEAFSKLGTSLLNGASWVGGQSADIIVKGFKGANNSLISAFGNQKMKINHAIDATDTEGKDEISFTKTILKQISSNGKADDIEDSLKTLISTINILDKHRLELETYFHKELSIFESFSKVKTTEDCVKALEKIKELEYPTVKFPNSNNTMSETDVLPGGLILGFNKENYKYSVTSEDISPDENDNVLSKDKIKSILKQVSNLESFYQLVVKSNKQYMDYVGKFNTVVGESFKHMETLKGEVSISIIRDLQSRMEGNPRLFAFYTGFLPKVTIYIDDYVSDITSFVSKQFN